MSFYYIFYFSACSLKLVEEFIYTTKKIISIIEKIFIYSLIFFVFLSILYTFTYDGKDFSFLISWLLVGIYGGVGYIGIFILKFFFSWENKLEKITEYKIHNPPYLDFIFYNKGFYDMSFVNSKVSKDIHRKFNPWNDYLETEENINLVFKNVV